MSDKESLVDKRRRLAADIARQRGELTRTYADMAKPLQYTEYAMRGFGLVRQNPWIFSVVPAAFTITSVIFGIVRGVKGKAEPRGRKLFEREARDVERDAERESKGLGQQAMKWGKRGWKAFRMYSRYRKFFS